jgi:hypothetical protein
MTASSPASPRHRPISISLRSLGQLFNSLDPSPFHDRDLDSDASRFLVDEAEDRASHEALTIRIHMPREEAERAEFVPQAIRAHFARWRQSEERNLRRVFREGRRALLVGVLIVVVILTGIELARGWLPETSWAQGVLESLVILAWVVLWRPAELLLYDWAPIARRAKLYGRLERAGVECQPIGG